MEIAEVFGYIGALIIGLVLGLIGGGGSILGVPVLVYLFSFNPITATAYSLFIVGFSATVGAVKNFQKKLIDFKIAAVFAIPAFSMVYITRKFILPIIPEQLFSFSSFVMTKDLLIMLLFAIMMLLAAMTMLSNSKNNVDSSNKQRLSPILIINQAIVIGFFTGLVGAGGGFVIIPALIILGNLPMKKAIGTSLLIIAVNSLIGFLGSMDSVQVDWLFLSKFTFVSIIGIFLGNYMSNFIEGKKLKKSFGWFVLVMGVYIIFKELF
jgi:uncharacterized membrane protein YfcA